MERHLKRMWCTVCESAWVIMSEVRCGWNTGNELLWADVRHASNYRGNGRTATGLLYRRQSSTREDDEISYLKYENARSVHES